MPEIEGYEILGELGRGGMAVVFKARQLRLDRIVALKLLTNAQFSGPDLMQRFEAEARLIGGISHPGIVKVFEAGFFGSVPYFTLEYVSGGSLARCLAGTPMQPREAARLIRRIADAVQAAHAAGIVHRDLKPANILMDADGNPKVADFGIAKDLAAPEGPTRTGDIFGTPGYMAPEQAGGVSRVIRPAVDVYALGAILYEMLTGRPPFCGHEPVETLLLVLTEDPVSIRRLAPKTDVELETICLKCLSKDHRRRYATAGELAADLDRYLGHQPILARPIGPVGKAVKWIRRHPAWFSTIAAAAVSLSTFSIYAYRKNVQLTSTVNNLNRSLVRNRENYRKAVDAVVRRINSEGSLQSDPLREELAFFEEIRGQNLEGEDARSEAAQWERATAAGWSGTLFGRLNDPVAAQAAFEQSITGLTELVDQHPDQVTYLVDLLDIRNRYGKFLTAENRTTEARDQFLSAITLNRRLCHQLDSATIAEDSEQRRLKSVTERDQGTLLVNLAIVQRQLGEDPLPAYEEALALRTRLSEEQPDSPAARRDLAIIQVNLGAFRRSQQDTLAAIGLFRSAVESLEHIASHQTADDTFTRTLIGAELNLASSLSSVQDSEAFTWYEQGAALLEAWLRRAPSSIEARQMLAEARLNWALSCLVSGNPRCGKEQLSASLLIYDALIAEFPETRGYQEKSSLIRGYLEEVDKELQNNPAN